MIGTLVNAGAVVAGSAIGLGVGPRLPERIKLILMQALGLSVVVIGLRMALEAQHALLAIACLLLGGLTGELLHIEQRLENLAETLRQLLRSDSSRFVEGFVTATLLYLTGAMTIVGSIQDGTVGDPSVLLIKALLDGVACGYWEWFRKDGTKMRSGHFENGEQVGEWTTYDKNGEVYKVTTMKAKKK